MKVQELTKKIHDEYPAVWKKLKVRYQRMCVSKDYMGIQYGFYNAKINYHVNHEIGYEEIPIPFSMLYGLLEDFFEENGIAIEVTKDYTGEIEEWEYQLIWILHDKYFQYGSIIRNDFLLLKQEAKQQAILKACEILEDKL